MSTEWRQEGDLRSTGVASEPLEALIAAGNRADVLSAVVDYADQVVRTDGVRVAQLTYRPGTAYHVLAHNRVGPDPSAAIVANPLSHPIVVEYIRTRFNGLVAMSDLLPGRQWSEHPLYRDVYRPVGLKYQISCALTDDGRAMHSLSLNRGGADFTRKERTRLLWFRNAVRSALTRVDNVNATEQALMALEESISGGRGEIIVITSDRQRVLYVSRQLKSEFATERNLAAAVHRALMKAELPLSETIGSGPTARVLRAHLTSAGIVAVVERATETILTTQERRVLAGMCTGCTTHALARGLGLSVRTVNKHIEHIYRKLGVHDRVSAVLAARAADLA